MWSVFYVVGGVKGGLHIGSCKDGEGIVRFPQRLSLSLMSLERCVSRSDSAGRLLVIHALVRPLL